jgi:hypothetical protein
MIKFINILSETVISEQKKYRFHPDTISKLKSVVDKLWDDRKKKYKGKTPVDVFQFKLADGTDGLVKVIVNPRLPYIGFMGTKPKKSLDPADIFIEVNPKHYQSKKNLYLTLFHEMIHASDPTQSHEWKPSNEITYNPKKDEMYWGHPIEFFAITNEFLEGLTNEFERRVNRYRNTNNLIVLEKSLDNILRYFAKGEPLSKLSNDILYRINDEYVNQNEVSKVLSDISNEFHDVAEIIPSKDVPYYLHYVELIKKYNPKVWPRFLTMLVKTKDDIKNTLNEKKLSI